MLDAYERQIGYFDHMRAQVTDWQNTQIATFRRAGGVGDYISQMFSGADRYVLQLNFQLPEPIRTLTLACPLAYDTTRSSNLGLDGVLGASAATAARRTAPRRGSRRRSLAKRPAPPCNPIL